MNWDRSVGSPMAADGSAPPVMWIKYLFRGFGWHVDLHKIVRADAPQCWHTHPYDAWRVILWGGYMEEYEDRTRNLVKPFTVSKVCAATCHRVHELWRIDWSDVGYANLRRLPSYSLWVHRPPAPHARMEFRGAGWGMWRDDA